MNAVLNTRTPLIVLGMALMISLFSCMLTKGSAEKKYYRQMVPPNGIKIAENLYIDQTEISNIDWTEYMAWTSQVFGPKSAEYAATQPDDSVWILRDSCLGVSLRNYWTHPNFEEYPMLGISQKQAENYAKWRSDRVFEYILYSHGIISYDARQSSKTHFTIERYFSGKYQKYKPDTAFRYYLEYRLPTIPEWQQGLSYADSVENAYLDKCKSATCRTVKLMWPDMQCDVTPCLADTLFMMPLRKARSGFVPEKQKPVYNLRGNVSEWSSDSGISTGGSWIHKRNEILAKDTFHSKSPNSWTGFRNVCEWKVYK